MLKGLARLPASINQGSSIDNLADFSQLRIWPTYCKSIVALFGAPVSDEHHFSLWLGISSLHMEHGEVTFQNMAFPTTFLPPPKEFSAVVPTVLSPSLHIPLILPFPSFFPFFLPMFKHTKKTNNLDVDTKLLVAQQLKSRCSRVNSTSIRSLKAVNYIT